MKTDSASSRSEFAAGRFWLGITTLAFLIALIPSISVSAQQVQPETQRKAVQKSAPSYPTIAKALTLSGTVKVAVKIAPNGKVLSAEALGGHPVFAQPAVDAVRQWRLEAGRQETEEVVYVKFVP